MSDKKLEEVELMDEELDTDDDNAFEGTVDGSIYYKTGQVAEKVGISGDMVRYYFNEFSEMFHVVRNNTGKNSHVRFPEQDIPILESIINLKKLGKSNQEVREILSEPKAFELMQESDRDKVMGALIAKGYQYAVEEIKGYLDNEFKGYLDNELEEVKASLKEANRKLEESENRENQLSKELKETSELMKTSVEMLKDYMEKPKKKKRFWQKGN